MPAVLYKFYLYSYLFVLYKYILRETVHNFSCSRFGSSIESLSYLKNLKVFRVVETHQRSRGKVPTIGEQMKRGGLSVVKK